MPKRGTRGMGPIAEAGESPQFKLYGSISTRSNINEISRGSDLQSPFNVTSYSNSLLKSGELYCYAYLKTSANPINLSILVNRLDLMYKKDTEYSKVTNDNHDIGRIK